ncbi:M14 family metallopeptidase [Pseudocolwellia sp. HL-MZ7]|uniref:M14 family metallopeptidase n=1 Tax=Pseudocolwellia sp. HL-MZ7 TaxID=3400627 RepID=UPI003CEB1744
MFKSVKISILALIPLLIVGCHSINEPVSFISNNDCETHGVIITKDFEAGRFNTCKVINENHIELSLSPENIPIMATPWYAFKVESTEKKSIDVTLHYLHHKHRYSPKISQDLQSWTLLDEDKVSISEDNKQVTLSLTLNDKPLWIASHSIIDNSFYNDWLAKFSHTASNINVQEIGKSEQSRSLVELSSFAGELEPTIILLGRQHPPEITGVIALQSFVDRIFENDKLARIFRQNFNVLIYPNINPDGVALGNWRSNSKGKDLNRDWGPFNEKETQQVIKAIENKTSTSSVWGMLDFHTTWSDLLYTQTEQQPSRFPEFTKDWIHALNNSDAPIKFEHKQTHRPSSPTTKQYFYERYKIPAITFELGENSDFEDIKISSTIAAEKYMQQLLVRKQAQ